MSKEKCKLLWWLNQDTTTHYNFMELVYNGNDDGKAENAVSRHPIAISADTFDEMNKNFDFVICNAKVDEHGNVKYVGFAMEDVIFHVADMVRMYMTCNYGKDVALAGHDMEACALIQTALRLYGIDAQIVTGECMLDNILDDTGRNCAEHTWIEIGEGDDVLFVDVTADQFNPYCFAANYQDVLIWHGLPHGMMHNSDNAKKETAITKTPIRLLAYELYKRDWMKRHIPESHEMSTLFDWFSENQSDYIADEDNYEPQSLEAFIDERGYDGSIYACFNEFLSEEYLDHVYIEGLLVEAGYVAGLLPVYYVDVQELL